MRVRLKLTLDCVNILIYTEEECRMFTKVRLVNFRSFDDITFDLTQKKGQIKHFAVIYGENGMGKSNLARGIAALIDLLRTMDVRDLLDSLLSDEKFRKLTEVLGDQRPTALLRDIPALIQEYRMVGTVEPIRLEYEFLIDGRTGRYCVELGETQIIHERLEYVLDKRRGVYFDLTPDVQKINPSIFQDNTVLKDMKELVKQYWGKHTLLAILVHEQNNKSERYITEGLSPRFYTLMQQLCALSCYLRDSEDTRELLKNHVGLLVQLEEGTVNKSKKEMLDCTARALTCLFQAVCSDNRRLYYKIKEQDERIHYELYIRKWISGKEREIKFEQESTGNHQLLRIFPYLLRALLGETVVIDEIETGIHDFLMKKILEELIPSIQGQLIVTSHNTSLMEIDNIRASVYIIKEDVMANKEILCIDDYEQRTYQQNNIRERYKNNAYMGIPRVEKIDFEALLKILCTVDK